MGGINDYARGSTETAPSAEEVVRRSYINEYRIAEPQPKSVGNARVAPPISGATREQSDELNARPSQKGTGTRSAPSLTEAVSDKAMEGVHLATEGLGDVFNKKPATGLGKMALGAVQVPFSLASGSAEFVKRLTGSDIGDRATLALPVAPAASAVNKAMPRNKALNELVDKITSGGRDQQALVDTIAAMKADPRIGPVDTSPTVLNMTQKLFVTEGDAAKAYLFNTSKDRVSNLSGDVVKSFDELGGVPVNVVQKITDLANAAKKAGSELINPVLETAKPVNVSKTIDQIDAVLKPGVWNKIDANSGLPLSDMKRDLSDIKKYLTNNKEMRTDAKDLHQFQSSLRRTAEDLLGSASGAERQLGQQIMKVRNNLVDDIEASATGYKAGLNAYREEKHIADAFKEGYQSTAKGMEKDPAFTKKWFDSLTDAEKEAAREGKRLSIAHTMGRANNPSLAGTNAARSDFNKQELEIFFGKEGTNKLLRELENTRAIKNTDQKIIEGSQTQMRAAGDKAVALPDQGQPNVIPWIMEGASAIATGNIGLGVGAYYGAKAVSKINHMIQTKLAKERNLHLSEMAMPVEGPKRDALIKELETFIPGPKPSLVNRVINSLPISP